MAERFVVDPQRFQFSLLTLLKVLTGIAVLLAVMRAVLPHIEPTAWVAAIPFWLITIGLIALALNSALGDVREMTDRQKKLHTALAAVALVVAVTAACLAG